MLKSCKAAQSAYLDNGGIAAHESPAGPASCTIGPATRSRSAPRSASTAVSLISGQSEVFQRQKI